MSVSFDGTDMELIAVANESQRIANSSDCNVFITIDNETLTVAIPDSTDKDILLAQLKALRGEE